jgi:triacylglycerol lipase
MVKYTLLLAFPFFIHFTNRKIDFFPKFLKSLIRWLHAITFETLVFLMGLLLRPLGYFTNQKKARGPSSGRPILLIHGYLHDSSAWVYLRKKLSREGFGPIYTLNLIHPFLSIRSYGEEVRKKAEEIALETGRKDLILMGHSMGGLVSAWYATKLAPPSTVTDVITLGSPLKGTYVAHIAVGPNGKEMRPHSEFVQELQKAIAESSHIRFHHIGTKTDQLVIPHTSSWLGEPSERHFILDDIGHVTLLFSPRVLQKISHWLNGALSLPI